MDEQTKDVFSRRLAGWYWHCVDYCMTLCNPHHHFELRSHKSLMEFVVVLSTTMYIAV